jgi:hypothetical protein
MTRRLSGWQRIGVVVSVCWFVGSCASSRFIQYHRGLDSAKAAVALCAAFPNQPPYKTFDQCWDENSSYRQSALAPYWPLILFLAIVPIPIFWIFGWIALWATRWVRAGFVS